MSDPPRSGGLAGAIREHRALLAMVGVALAASLVAERAAGVPGLTLRALAYWRTWLFFAVLAAVPVPLLLGAALRAGLREGLPEGTRPLAAAWRRLRAGTFATDRVLGVVLATVLLGVVINLFSTWKIAIPRVQPFAWDAAFHRLDVAMHGGRMPWEWLQPALGHRPVTRFLDAVYLLWHPVIGLTTAAVLWSGNRALRLRFLLASTLAWLLLGAGAAVAFSSAGPCYWDGVLGGPNPYAPLFAYLGGVDAEAPLAALRIQEGLWTRYVAQAGVGYSGISAMPSLHVAVPALFLPLGRAWGGRVGWGIAAAFALLTLLGSVHLGWHYAVDGYAGIAGAAVLWWMAGWGTRARRGGK